MKRVNGSGQRVMGAACLVATLLLSTAVMADTQDEGGGSGDVIQIDDGQFVDGHLIMVDPIPFHPGCDGDCIAVGEPDPSGTDDGTVVDDGSGDDGSAVDDGSGDGSGDDGTVVDDNGGDDGTAVDDGSGDDGSVDQGTDEGADPVVVDDEDPGCGSCIFETTAGGINTDGSVDLGPIMASRGAVGHSHHNHVAVMNHGPDLCLAHDPALAWICGPVPKN